MIKVRAPRKLVADINVVPYIDVMLVLLVVFMITAPMMTQGLQVDLPKTTSQPIVTDEEPVVITVKKDGNYFINVGETQQTSSSLENVSGHVQRIKRNAPETLFLVEGDTEVPYGRVIELMAMLQGAGIERLGLVTEPPEPTGR
ncbi:biopolymer transport protein TolR [Alcanivorax sp. S71-1-4]|jgi:biopolymer transport protein TolR|uniref:Tol-Pal system protein TolR n=1 Tax=Isoalcanivorax pacificus W11-5 TaxID=391936 RepID=A0A0B4XKP9_9GAMM|nr:MULTISPECIES: protein TolR [Alcanivoracaceae]AJD47681.1 biopolymer transport protein TolR [Isoalcanivorax pacificus W11-5]KAF0810232.1 biopolymer transport protein TolR [Alcanivorax sp. S71-1-4]